LAKKYFLSFTIGMVTFLWIMTQAFAQAPAEQMQKRIDDLEKQVNELKLMIQEQQKARAEEKARVDKVEQKVDQTEKTKTASSSGASTASSIISECKFKPYGFVKLDAVHDDKRVYPSSGNYIVYVPSEKTVHQKHESFSMTARQTQLGLYILAPETYSWVAKGRVEMDFYGDGTAHENKAEPLLRQAYVELTKGNYDIIAGQTNDLISPLAPNTLNYTVGWDAGNIGYRRPQLRFTYTYPVNAQNKLIGAIAAVRYKGLSNEDIDGDSKNDGEDAGYPTIQGRLAWATKQLFCTEKESVFGISGHYGQEKIDWSMFDTNIKGYHQRSPKTWSINADYEVPLTKRLALKGEWFYGSNLDDYFGGIGQGINTLTTGKVGSLVPVDEQFTSNIQSMGGWTQLTYQYNKWKYNVGAGIDDPRNSDLSTASTASKAMRSRNTFYFGNFYYNLIPPVNLCLEYSHWDTKYKGFADGKDDRIQTSVIFNW
jgi:hypothetical protein